VNPLITFGAFSPTDYADVSSQACSLTVESNLSIVASALQGTVLAASAICSALPAIASNICWGANAVFSIADAVLFGLFADCTEQDGNVNAAKIDAGFHNTVTIFDALGTDFTSLNTALSTDFTNLNTALSTDFTNLTTTVNSDSATTDALITTDFMALTNQISQGTALLQAYLKQIMKLELTPNGQKVIDPPILTCTGTNCPNVLAMCPAAGCSWNSAGPLP
jgi:Flp pilus assembly pilin Flp